MSILWWKKKKEIIVERPKVGVALFTTYTSCMGMGTSFMPPSQDTMGGPGFNARDFFEFTSEEVTERRKTECKVKGAWLDYEDVLFYNDIKEKIDIQIYTNKMTEKYQLRTFTDIHRLYDHGLSVSYGMFNASNNFFDKALEKKINKDMDTIIYKGG